MAWNLIIAVPSPILKTFSNRSVKSPPTPLFICKFSDETSFNGASVASYISISAILAYLLFVSPIVEIASTLILSVATGSFKIIYFVSESDFHVPSAIITSPA